MRVSSPRDSTAGARTCSGTLITRWSDPGLRADARDGEALRCDGRRHDAVRITLAVEVLRVHERDLARKPQHVAQEFRHRDSEAQVDERLGDLAAANAERPIACHAGDDPLARMHDTEIVQP